ncbi:MAG: hypothetical protein LJE91_12155 [Gammaproteobacteria bacterium]|jgi:hypothetical protein|nr:hypothetical protein [Gammaproteobacteria bacterium]
MNQAMVLRRYGAVLASIVALCVGDVPDAGAEPFVYPARGQGSSQEEQDKYECHQCSRQTGVDPE